MLQESLLTQKNSLTTPRYMVMKKNFALIQKRHIEKQISIHLASLTVFRVFEGVFKQEKRIFIAHLAFDVKTFRGGLLFMW
jgi:hypothetical protein